MNFIDLSSNYLIWDVIEFRLNILGEGFVIESQHAAQVSISEREVRVEVEKVDLKNQFSR